MNRGNNPFEALTSKTQKSVSHTTTTQTNTKKAIKKAAPKKVIVSHASYLPDNTSGKKNSASKTEESIQNEQAEVEAAIKASLHIDQNSIENENLYDSNANKPSETEEMDSRENPFNKVEISRLFKSLESFLKFVELESLRLNLTAANGDIEPPPNLVTYSEKLNWFNTWENFIDLIKHDIDVVNMKNNSGSFSLNSNKSENSETRANSEWASIASDDKRPQPFSSVDAELSNSSEMAFNNLNNTPRHLNAISSSKENASNEKISTPFKSPQSGTFDRESFYSSSNGDQTGNIQSTAFTSHHEQLHSKDASLRLLKINNQLCESIKNAHEKISILSNVVDQQKKVIQSLIIASENNRIDFRESFQRLNSQCETLNGQVTFLYNLINFSQQLGLNSIPKHFNPSSNQQQYPDYKQNYYNRQVPENNQELFSPNMTSAVENCNSVQNIEKDLNPDFTASNQNQKYTQKKVNIFGKKPVNYYPRQY